MANEQFTVTGNETAGVYVRGADGKFYEEIKAPGGEFDYRPAAPGLSFKELPNGKYIAIRDMAVAQAQRAMSSSEQFFSSIQQETNQAARNRLKRIDAYERQFAQVAIDRVAPGPGPRVERITDEKYLDLHAQYRAAVAKGPEAKLQFEQEVFAPVASYRHKLVTATGKIIRPEFKGECGTYPNGTIVCLEEGYGTGNLVAVPEQIK